MRVNRTNGTYSIVFGIIWLLFSVAMLAFAFGGAPPTLIVFLVVWIGIGIGIICLGIRQKKHANQILTEGTQYVGKIVDFETERVGKGDYRLVYVVEYTNKIGAILEIRLPSDIKAHEDIEHPVGSEVEFRELRGDGLITGWGVVESKEATPKSYYNQNVIKGIVAIVLGVCAILYGVFKPDNMMFSMVAFGVIALLVGLEELFVKCKRAKPSSMRSIIESVPVVEDTETEEEPEVSETSETIESTDVETTNVVEDSKPTETIQDRVNKNLEFDKNLYNFEFDKDLYNLEFDKNLYDLTKDKENS